MTNDIKKYINLIKESSNYDYYHLIDSTVDAEFKMVHGVIAIIKSNVNDKQYLLYLEVEEENQKYVITDVETFELLDGESFSGSKSIDKGITVDNLNEKIDILPSIEDHVNYEIDKYFKELEE